MYNITLPQPINEQQASYRDYLSGLSAWELNDERACIEMDPDRNTNPILSCQESEIVCELKRRGYYEN